MIALLRLSGTEMCFLGVLAHGLVGTRRAHSARPSKILGCLVLLYENFSVNKLAYSK